MIDLEKINPVSDFVRNYKTYLGRIKETGHPEALTINGKPEYVIMDAKTYSDIADEIERRRFIKAVKEGIDSMNSGNGKEASVAFAQIRSKLGL